MYVHTDELKRAKQNITVHNEHLDEMFVCIFLNTHIGVINMSVLLALAIIVAIIAAVCTVKAVRSATKAVVTTTSVVAEAAPSVAHTQDVCDPINSNVAHSDERHEWLWDYVLVTSLVAVTVTYTHIKWAAKAAKRDTRTMRGKLAHKAACAHIRAQRKARSNAMSYVTSANTKAIAKADERKALVRAHNAPSATYAQLGACGIKAAKRAALGINVATHRRVVPIVHTHVCTPAVVRTIKRVPSVKAANAAPRGKDLAAAAQSVHGNLIARIHAAKATLNSMYEILPLARQVVGLSNKANRKVDMYTWLSNEGHVGIRSTKSSIDRRDVAQELVCKAILAEEAFKKAYGIEAHEVYNTIRAAKATKARAVEMLRNHKAEQHRLFIERQERRAAKAAFRASKAAPAAAKTVTEVADWKEYVVANSGNKSIAFGILHAKGSTMAEKISAAIAIVGASHEDGLVSCQTADAAYMVAA